MNEIRVKKFIQIAKDKASKNMNIKNEIFALSTFYEFIKTNDDYKYLVSLMEKELERLNLYQKQYDEQRKIKRLKKLKLKKEVEYKMIWSKKTFFYKLIHRNLNPKNNDLKHMILEDVENIINKLNTVKKIKK